MNISYYIQPKKANSKGKTTVMLDFAWRGYRLQVSSGVMVSPENFINDAKKLIHTREENSLSLNWKLAQLRLNLMAGYLKLDGEAGFEKEITLEQVRTMAKKLTGKADKSNYSSARASEQLSAKPTGTDIWVTHTRWQDLNRLKHSASHLRRFLPVKKWLDRYAPHFTLEELNEEWVQGYTNWLLENSSLRNGGMRAHFIFFRLMLKFAHLPFEWLKQPFSEYTPGVDLTYEEVQRIYRTDYSSLQLRETADMYVFLCQVGLRFSDYLLLKKVTPIQTDSGEVLVIMDHLQKKTKQAVTIPLNPLARTIWEKYGGNMPNPTNQTYNQRLKQMGKGAGLNRMVEVTTVRGNDYTTLQRPLYEVISAHTSRHTFACLVLEAKSSDIHVVSNALGHATDKTTGIYARHKQAIMISDTLEAFQELDRKHNSGYTPNV